MRIACIGDSNTFGQNVRSDQAWPHLLWAMTGHDVRNLGVNGDTTRLGLERWHRDVDLLEPDVVVIQFGHNDANLWDGEVRVSVEEFENNIMEMIERSDHFIILPPHDTNKAPEYDSRISGYRGGMHPLGIPILDDGYGVHPTPEGHQMYADYVASLL